MSTDPVLVRNVEEIDVKTGDGEIVRMYQCIRNPDTCDLVRSTPRQIIPHMRVHLPKPDTDTASDKTTTALADDINVLVETAEYTRNELKIMTKRLRKLRSEVINTAATAEVLEKARKYDEIRQKFT